MATTVTPEPTRTRSRARLAVRIILGLVLVVVLLVVAALLWFRHAAYAALPQLEGTAKVAGLAAPVHVVRDAQGVPHITAVSLNDLMFAQGYVTAQDRLWQMDMSRRYAAGELSEVLGNSTFDVDVAQRILGLRGVAERAAQRLSERDRALGEAYVRGVNAYIEQHRGSLPIEFRVLRYEPKPWTTTDSFLVGAGMAQMLVNPLQHELTRERITEKIGPELSADLYPNSSWRDRPPASQANGADFSQPDPSQQQVEEEEEQRKGRGGDQPERAPRRHRRRAANDVDMQPIVPGSNNWVVSGAHTASGKPLLSNDMHLPLQMPSTWYEAHLKCAPQPQTPQAERDLCTRFDVAGVTLPGLPFVISGHNARVAWGFTNIGPTVQDLYVEKFNDNGQYQTPDGWKQPETRREIIRVKRTFGTKAVPLNVLVTRHGPIVTSLFKNEKRPLALKWTLYEPEGMTFPFFDVDTAQNWDEFTRAFSQFGSPAQNVVYADADGHIAYHATGKVPIRASGDGSAPVPGNDNAHEWTGFIPFDQLPTVFDPPSGILATANGRIVPDDYPHPVASEWGPPYRTERILRVLSAKQKLTPADMLALQTDVHSEFDRFCAQRLVYAVDRSPKVSKRTREAADILRKWNGEVTADSAATSIVTTARRELIRMLLRPKLGDEWERYRWFMSSVWLENTLLRQPQRWLPPNFSSYDEMLASALDRTVAAKGVPANLKDWAWGKQFEVGVSHPIFGRAPILRKWASSGMHPQSGDGYTVKQVGVDFGPSERLTVDFSNLDGSTLNIVSGQSGALFSPHFLDQWNAWLNGTTFPLPFSDGAVQKAKTHELVLE